MNTTLRLAGASLLLPLGTLPLLAGPSAEAETPAAGQPAAAEPWYDFSWDQRLRYEYAEVDGLDAAHALTLRTRPGLLLRSPAGPHRFSGFVEGEHNWTIVDDFNAAPAPVTHPNEPNTTQINDPENFELNQLWLRYQYEDMLRLTAGRQRLIYDKAAFVGNVGWRQNEQTFDAAEIQWQPLDWAKLNYAYVWRVNRIFGDDAPPPLGHLDGQSHLVQGEIEAGESTRILPYFFHLDFDNPGGALSCQTFGVRGEHGLELPTGALTLSQDVAWQQGIGDAPDYDAWYSHSVATYGLAGHAISLGYEHLGADDGTSFRTPLATAHAYNGFADAFVPARIAGTPSGLGDLYLAWKFPLPAEIKGQVVYHAFGGDDFSFNYGQEIDFVLSYAITEELSTTLKLAHYWSEGGAGNPAPADTTRLSLQLDYKF